MSKKALIGVIVGAGALAILTIGCSSSDKGTGSSVSDPQKQYEEMSEFISFDPNDESGINVVPMIVPQLSSDFWDGVEASDFDGFGGFLFPGGFGNAKISAQADEDSLFYTYDPTGGWWTIYVSYSSSEVSGAASMTLRDSVRFENASGTAQMVPDDQTATFKERSSLDVMFQFSDETSTFNLDLASASNLTATNLNTSTITLNGSISTNVDLQVDGEQNNSAKMLFDLDAQVNNVMFPNDDSEDPCPTSGTILADFTLDMDVQDTGETYKAKGDWDITIGFQNNGQAEVTVTSGDFTTTATGPVCQNSI